MQRQTLIILVFAAFAPPVLAAPSAMQPGLWEITTKIEMSGMPMPSQTLRHCYTKQDIEQGQGTVPQ